MLPSQKTKTPSAQAPGVVSSGCRDTDTHAVGGRTFAVAAKVLLAGRASVGGTAVGPEPGGLVSPDS
jgi:hypothetical protein